MAQAQHEDQEVRIKIQIRHLLQVESRTQFAKGCSKAAANFCKPSVTTDNTVHCSNENKYSKKWARAFLNSLNS